MSRSPELSLPVCRRRAFPLPAATLRAVALLVATLLSLATPDAARAGGFAIPEVGIRRTGMAAVVGRPDDLSAVYHNPAGLTLVEGAQLYLSFGAAFVDTEFQARPWPESDRFISAPVDAQGFYPATRPSRSFAVIPMLAASLPLLGQKLVGAVSFYIPNAMASSFDSEGVLRYHLVDSYVVTGFGGFSLAYRPWPWLSIGAGLSLIYVRLHGERSIFPILDGKDLSTLLGGNSYLTIDGEDYMVGWNLGVLVWLHPRFSLAATVIGRSNLTVEGPISIRIGDSGAELRGWQKTGLLIPWTLMLGANFDLTRHVEIGGEFRYWFYSELKAQHTEIQDIGLLTAIDAPRDYSDSWQIAGGVRVHSLLRGLDTMVGFHYDRTPAPNSTVSLDMPSFYHVGLHLGARYRVGERFRISLSYTRYWYLERDVTDSLTEPPSNFRGGGSSNILTLNLEATIGRGLPEKRGKR